MRNFGIFLTCLAFAMVSTINARPPADPKAVEREIDIPTQQQMRAMKKMRPCNARLLEIRIELIRFDEIQTDPHYIPECTKDGKKWRPAQCDHDNDGACFCVHEDNGEIIEHTRDKLLHKEGLKCARSVNSDHSGHQCLHMQDEFNHMQETFGLESHTPLFYYPECTPKGDFLALQRNDRVFFCVDTVTGQMIPETQIMGGTMPPLTEDICAAYDKVWNEFQTWKSSLNIENEQAEANKVVTPESCKPGQIYTECGCPVKCTFNSNQQVKKSCTCKPACVCPEGYFDLEGKCVTLEECNDAKPPSEVPQADKLDDLTNGLWGEYKRKYPNIVLETYNAMGMEEEMFEGGPVAYDVDPNSDVFLSQPPPEETAEFEFIGAEGIPGGNTPHLRQFLHEIGNPDPEAEEYLNNQRNQEEEEFFEEEVREEENERETQPEEENERIPPVEEERYPTERESYPTEEETYPMEVKEEESYPREEEYVREPEIEEEQENAASEEEVVEHQNEEPVEIIEPENEVDERIEQYNNEVRIEHQTEENIQFSSVPPLSEAELEEHEATTEPTPCHDEEVTEKQVVSEDEAAMAAINHILSENGILMPSIEATLDKPTQSIKKNTPS